MKKLFISFMCIAFIGKAQSGDFKSDMLHIWGTCAIAMGTGYTINKVTKDRHPFISALIGGAFAFGVGAAKEYIWDRQMGRGVFNKEDLISNARGSVAGVYGIAVILHIRRKEYSEKLMYLDEYSQYYEFRNTKQY